MISVMAFVSSDAGATVVLSLDCLAPMDLQLMLFVFTAVSDNKQKFCNLPRTCRQQIPLIFILKIFR